MGRMESELGNAAGNYVFHSSIIPTGWSISI